MHIDGLNPGTDRELELFWIEIGVVKMQFLFSPDTTEEKCVRIYYSRAGMTERKTTFISVILQVAWVLSAFIPPFTILIDGLNLAPVSNPNYFMYNYTIFWRK